MVQLTFIFTTLALAQIQSDNVCLDEHFIKERRQAALQKRVKQRPKYIINDIPKRSVVVDVSGYINSIAGRHSLPMKLNEVRSKSYLRLDRIVLIGTGFDDERLIEEAETLELNGFRDVKVLVNGRRSSLFDDFRDNEIQLVTPSKSLTALASSWFPNEYTLIVWNDYIDLLKPLGINPIKLDQSSYDQQIQSLMREIKRVATLNSYAKYLLATPNEQLHKRILADDSLKTRTDLWLIQEGEQGLIRAIQNSKIDPKRMRNHKFACGNG